MTEFLYVPIGWGPDDKAPQLSEVDILAITAHARAISAYWIVSGPELRTKMAAQALAASLKLPHYAEPELGEWQLLRKQAQKPLTLMEQAISKPWEEINSMESFGQYQGRIRNMVERIVQIQPKPVILVLCASSLMALYSSLHLATKIDLFAADVLPLVRGELNDRSWKFKASHVKEVAYGKSC